MNDRTVKSNLLVITLSVIAIFISHFCVEQLVNQYFANQFKSESAFKILLIWGTGFGEQEQTHRFKLVGKRLGIDLRVVSAKPTNWLYRWYVRNPAQTAANIMQPDFALTIERNIPPIQGAPNYLVLDEDKNAYMSPFNLVKFSGLLPTFPEIDELEQALNKIGVPFYGFSWYPTIYRTNYVAQEPTKLFYPGGVLRDTTRSSNKYKDIFKSLDKTTYLAIYGSKNKWSHISKSLNPPIPFDGISLLDIQNSHGISLVLHDEQHLYGNVPSGRIFEAAAANTVIISDQHSFVREHFGSDVLYIDVRQNADSVVQQIDQHVKWILANPEIAHKMASKCHEIFMQKFTLENQLIRLIELNNRIKSELKHEKT